MSKTAYLFPGQGSQKPGMGKELYHNNQKAQEIFNEADQILNFSISEIMFEGTTEDLQKTKVTQPAIFVHSLVLWNVHSPPTENAVAAGHSLGEFAALVAAKVLSFESGLHLVLARAKAMQQACEKNKGTMAAILGMEDQDVEEVCEKTDAVVVPANYNTIGQLVISGSEEGVDTAIEELKSRGARRVLKLPVGGAFHSPLMEPARTALAHAIEQTEFNRPIMPVYQNVDALPETDPRKIQEKLLLQLTSPVRWTQIIQNMINDEVTQFVEIGADVLSGMVKKIDRNLPTEQIIS